MTNRTIGEIYAPTREDICLNCGERIDGQPFATVLKLDPIWDRKEPFNFEKHCTDELKGYKHRACL